MPKKQNIPLKKRMWITICDNIISFAQSLPRFKNSSIAYIQNIRRDFPQRSNEKPSDIETKLEFVIISEAFTIRYFEKNASKILKTLKDYKPAQRFPFSEKGKDQIKEDFSKLGNFQSIYVSNTLGTIVFRNDKSVTLSDSIEISIKSYGGTHVILTYVIKPNETFNKSITQLINKNIASKIILKLPKTWKSFKMGHIGYSCGNKNIEKRNLIQNEIIKLKEEVINFSNKRLKGLFYKKGNLIPSTEVWTYSTTEQTNTKNETGPTRGSFLDSLGMPLKDNYYCYSNSDKSINLFNDSKLSTDVTIKVLLDSSKINTDDFNSIHSYISFWLKDLQRSQLVKSYLLDFQEELYKYQCSTLIQNKLIKKYKFKDIVLPLADLELKSKLFLKHINSRSLFGPSAKMEFPNLESDHHNSKLNCFKTMKDDFDFNVKNYYENLKDTKNILKTSLDSHVLISNQKTQNKIVLLTVITLGITLYQLLSKNQQKSFFKFIGETYNAAIFNSQRNSKAIKKPLKDTPNINININSPIETEQDNATKSTYIKKKRKIESSEANK